MATYRTVTTDFTGGLMSPYLRGRVDIDKFNKGLQRMDNFLPSIQGPTRFRSGTEWVRSLVSGDVRLIEFTLNTQNRFLLALSAGLLCVYNSAGTLLYTRGGGVDSNGVPIAADDGFGTMVTVPYLENEIRDVRYSREVETMVFTHPMHPPYVLVANTAYDELALTAVSGITTTLGTDSQINGTFTNPLAQAANGKARWTLFDSGGTLEYWDIEWDGTSKWLFLVGADHPTLAENTIYFEALVPVGADPDDVPTEGWAAVALGAGTIPTVVEEVVPLQAESEAGSGIYHDLFSGSIGSEGLRPWAFYPEVFTSHPFQRVDTSGTVLKISNEVERVRLISTASDWVVGDVGKYTEYKVGNQWSLGEIVEYVSETEVLVDPVESVVNIQDPSVRLAVFDNRDPITPTNPAKGWLDRDGVDAGKTHVRADTLIFRTSHIGSWVRIGGDRLFTNVCDPVGSSAFNSQDGNIRWGKIIDYRGVEDHPVDFITGPLAVDDFDAGSVYEVYEWGPLMTEIDVQAPSGTPLTTAKVLTSGATWRFSMNHTFVEAPPLSSTSETILANMSSQLQFDVVEVGNGNGSSEDLLVSGDNLITPTGDVIAYDLVTDPRKIDGESGTYATHTATLTASRIFFNADRDTGRYVLGNLVDRWVLMRINGTDLLPFSAQVDVLSSIPRDELTDDVKNNGVFTQFRLGAWYKDNYPYTVSFYEQRRVFAGTRSHPNLVWLSDLNDSTDFRTVEPDGSVLDTTGITYPLGEDSTTIRWLEAGSTLVIGTEANEWQLRPNEFSAAVTSNTVRIVQETSIGSRVQGQRIGGSVFFPHVGGKELHELKYDFQSQKYVTETVTKLVPDLFEEDTIRSISYQFYPNSVLWVVTEGGKLYSLSYRKEDDYYAWAAHPTAGSYKEVEVVPKGGDIGSEDQVWFVVERDGINQLERMSDPFTDTEEDNLKKNATFLDSYVRFPKEGSLSEPKLTVNIPSRCIIDGKTALVVDGVYLGLVDVVEGENLLGPLLQKTLTYSGAALTFLEGVSLVQESLTYSGSTLTFPLPIEGTLVQKALSYSGEVITFSGNNILTYTEPSLELRDHILTYPGTPIELVDFLTYPESSVEATDHILIGIPYTGVLQMNPQAFDAGDKNSYGQTKRVVSMRPYIHKSMGYKIGFSLENLEEIEPSGGLSLFTGFAEEHTILDSNFDVDETPLIVQDKAYPLTIVSNVIKTDLH